MHIAIIGNGITGISAARHIRKLSDHSITVISGESEHFFSRTALMYIYMGHMRFEDTKPYEDWFWEKNRIALKKAWIEEVDIHGKSLKTSSGEYISYDKLLIASGSVYNKFDWPGQDLKGVQGLYSLQDLEELEINSKDANRAVIVGGGLIGIELAEMLHSRNIPVTLLVREKSYWNNVLPAGESEIINKHIRAHGFDLRLETELKEILPNENGRVRSVLTNKGEEILCDLVGLTAGVRPNISFLNNSGIETEKGVLVNQFMETDIPDVYAAGDCAQFREAPKNRRPVEQVWYTGREQGEISAYNICGKQKAYEPGPWFNSAKFLDIEYHTYGQIKALPDPGESSLYWEHPDGRKCIHLRYNTEDGLFLGVNSLGIRYRHLVFDKFLREKKDIEYVLENLSTANFDPEFFRQYEKHVLAQYNKESGKNLRTKSKKGLTAVLKLFTGK